MEPLKTAKNQASSPGGPASHRKMLIVLGALILLVGALTIQHFLLQGRADRQLLRLQSQGHPTDLVAVNESYAIPSGVTNAADIYLSAFNSFANDDRTNTNGPAHHRLASPIDDYPENVLQFVRGWVSTNSATLAKLHEGARHPHCRYPQDYTQGFNTLLPHLGQLKNTVRLLTWRAYLDAEKGDSEQMLRHLQTALRVSDSLVGEPDVIAQLVRAAGHAIVANRLEEILNRHQLSDAQLQRLFRILEGRESLAPLRAAFAGELCMGLDFFEDPNAFGGLNFNGVSTGGDRLKSMAAISGLKAAGFWERDRAFYIQLHEGYLNALSLSFPAALSAGKEVNARLDGSRKGIRNLVTQSIAPALSKIIEKEALRVTRLRLILVGLAVERYRLAHDARRPDSLDELVPDFLPSILQDPFDGADLRYRKLDTGYVIWAVGRDLTDDRGDLTPEGKHPKDPRFRMLR